MTKQTKTIIEDSIGAACIVALPFMLNAIAYGAGY